jgi:hypothetical protein
MALSWHSNCVQLLSFNENNSTPWTRMHYGSKMEQREHDDTSHGTLEITLLERSIQYKHDKCASRTISDSIRKLEI